MWRALDKDDPYLINVRAQGHESGVLANLWMDELREAIDPSVARAHKWGNRDAIVMQFGDGNLDSDRNFIDAYLNRLGAHVTVPELGRLAVNSRSIRTLAQSRNLPSTKVEYMSDISNIAPPQGLLSTSPEQAEIAQAGLSWQMEAKAADEILVTPTSLLEDPILKTDEERLGTVQEALQMWRDSNPSVTIHYFNKSIRYVV